MFTFCFRFLHFFYRNQILATIDYETAALFHFTGPYQSTPGCPIKLELDFNPSSGVPFYEESDAKCSKVATYNMPFFLARPGPKYESVSLAAHEARPGHHTQVKSYEALKEHCHVISVHCKMLKMSGKRFIHSALCYCTITVFFCYGWQGWK